MARGPLLQPVQWHPLYFRRMKLLLMKQYIGRTLNAKVVSYFQFFCNAFSVLSCWDLYLFIYFKCESWRGKRRKDCWNPSVQKALFICLFYNKMKFSKNLYLTLFRNTQKDNGKRKDVNNYPAFPNITHKSFQKSNDQEILKKIKWLL